MNRVKSTLINDLSLSLFNCVVETSEKAKGPSLIQEYGVLLTAGATYAESTVRDHLRKTKLTGEELNKTFHKSWDKVQKSSRFELLIEQLLHYSSTYGTDFTGSVYIPSETLDLDGKELPLYIIGALSKEQLVDKCKTMLSSGIAMEQDTINQVLSLLRTLDFEFTDVDWVKNKEAKVALIDQTGVLPKDPAEFLRYVVFKATDRTLLIKNRFMVEQIKESMFNAGPLFKKYDLKKLATIFNRYKPLFLAFKQCGAYSEVNKIAKLSKKYHKPLKQNPLNQVTQRKLTKKDLPVLEDATVFQLIKALNACVVRSRGQESFTYNIRNGKAFTPVTKKPMTGKLNKIWSENELILQEVLKSRFEDTLAGKTAYIPSNIRYGLPTSEKMFVGKFPLGTTVVGEKLNVGMYWENSWGARDLDLSGVSASAKIGWNSYYSEGGITYSGDITNAPNGAVEYLRIKELLDDTIVTVNCFSGNPFSHSYNIIVSDSPKASDNHMMDPSKLILNEQFTSTTGQSILGICSNVDGKIAFSLFPRDGQGGRVSSANPVVSEMRESLVQQVKNSLTFNQLLETIGIQLVTDPREADFDLSPDKVNKATFIEMLQS